MTEDVAGHWWSDELARRERLRLMARLTAVDAELERVRAQVDRGSVDVTEREAAVNQALRPGLGNLVLHLTGRHKTRVQAGQDALLRAFLRTRQMRWLQGAYEQERSHTRASLDALPSDEALARETRDTTAPEDGRRRVEEERKAGARSAAARLAAAMATALRVAGEIRGVDLRAASEMGPEADLFAEGNVENLGVRQEGSQVELEAGRLASWADALAREHMIATRLESGLYRDLGLDWATGVARAVVGDAATLDGFERRLAAIQALFEELQQELDAG